MGGAVINLRTGEVRAPDGSGDVLRPKSAALLRVLLERDGDLVTKDELLALVWPGLAVDEDALVQCVTEIRRAIGPRSREAVRTHAKRGYSVHPDAAPTLARTGHPTRTMVLAAFLALVAGFVFAARQSAPPEPLPTSAAESAGPVVAVMPFEDLTGEDRWQRLSRALTQEVIADLAQNPWLFVLADATTRGDPAAPRHFGAGYVVTGTVQVASGRARIAAALSDAASGRQLWSKRFEGPVDDLLSLQRAASAELVGELASNWSGPIARADRAKARARGTDDLAAYELYMLAVEKEHSFEIADLRASAALLRRVVEMAPEFGEAWAKLSLTSYKLVTPDLSPADRKHLFEEGHAAALKAYRVSPEAPYAIGQAANVIRWDDYAEAERMIRHAAALAANNADMLAYLSFRAVHFPTIAAEAVDWADRAARLNPGHPDWYDWNRGAALMAAGHYAEAAEAYGRAPHHPEAMAGRIAALALSGRVADARIALADLLHEQPDFTIAWHSDAAGLHPEVAETFAQGFRIAGAR